MELRNILIRYWGHSTFRPLQEDIIRSVLDGRDTLALLPTGGGKSICFQVPALAREGVCLVITPLIALMKDQVMNLKKKGIKASAIYSGMHPNEIQMALDNCAFGEEKFLYLSPERLQNENFLQALQKMKINLIAVDEAHCISQWGYDFRPPYLQIFEIRKYLPGIPVLALTATATIDVIADIQQKLGFAKENVFRKSFERKNLTYVVVKEEDKLGRLLRIFNKVKGTGIVYVRNRRMTTEIARFLQKNKISAGYYHAGLDMKTRESRQEAWMKEEIRVMVTTNAFGMGIDKPNVRTVVHMDLPDSLEAYFQEAGRAGRDEKQSYALLLYQETDLARLRQNLDSTYPPVEVIRNVYRSLGNYYQIPVGSGKDSSFDFDLSDFSKQAGLSPLIAYNSLKFIEKEGYISMNESLGNPSKVHIYASREDLYRFQVENRTIDPFIKLLLRSYSGILSGFIMLNEQELARRGGMEAGEVVKMLNFLQNNHILTYAPRKDKPQLIFLVERLDTANLSISPENYNERKKVAMAKIQSALDYVSSDDFCRSEFLLKYFGETSTHRCGKCDVCRQRNKVELNDLEFNQLRQKIKTLLLDKPMTLNELVYYADDYGEEHALKVIRWLEDKGSIIKDENQVYKWKKQFTLRI